MYIYQKCSEFALPRSDSEDHALRSHLLPLVHPALLVAGRRFAACARWCRGPVPHLLRSCFRLGPQEVRSPNSSLFLSYAKFTVLYSTCYSSLLHFYVLHDRVNCCSVARLVWRLCRGTSIKWATSSRCTWCAALVALLQPTPSTPLPPLRPLPRHVRV